jgi:hypothetical protein
MTKFEELATPEPKIFPAICAIMEEIGAIRKTKKNTQQGFMYRGIDDVMNALQPLLAKHRVFVVPSVLEQVRSDRETKSGGTSHLSVFKIKYTFYADDGSSFEAVTVGESDDTGDKGSNKAMAIAFKYVLFQVFCIPTEEMPDPDADTPEPSGKKKAAPVTSITPPATPKDDKPHVIKRIGYLLYPDAVGADRGAPNGYNYEIYEKLLIEYNKLDKNVKALQDLSLDKLLDMEQKMLPAVLQ